LQNYIIFLLLYQRFIITSNAITNPPTVIVADKARGNKSRSRSNYRNKRKNYNRFGNRTYNNNRGGLYKYRNFRKNNREDYLGGS
jgi:hypothetical protein